MRLISWNNNRQGEIWFLISFIFFPSASTAVFQMFNCDEDFESSSSYLKADYRLECDGSEYDGYLGYTIFMIFVYPIANETVIQLAKDSSKLSVVNFDNLSNSSSFYLWSREVHGRLAIERACADPATSPYSSLFGAYKPELWYWECVEWVRRLSLTGLLVFMYPGSDKQVLLAMLICFFWMMIYSNVIPYLESYHSFFMISSQWGVLLQLYAIYLIINHSFDASSELVGGFAV